MIYYTSNLAQGFDKNLPGDKIKRINNEFEYLIFFTKEIQKNSLVTTNSYSKKYLEYVKKIIGVDFSIISECQEKTRNFWYPREHLDNLLYLNSKKFSYNVRKNIQKYGRDFFFKAKDINNFKKNIFTEKMIAKPDLSFSGIGQKLISSSIDLKNLKGDYLVEKFYEIHKETSYYFVVEDNKIHERFYLNFSKSGQFVGVVTGNQKKISSLLKLNEKDKKVLRKIASFLFHKHDINFMQIDSFFYDYKNTRKFRFLSELNYRYTLGYISDQITRSFGDSKIGKLKIFPFKMIVNLVDYKTRESLFNMSSKSGILFVTPNDRNYSYSFFSVLIVADTFSEVSKLEVSLNRILF